MFSNDKVDLIHGLLRFSPLFLAIDVALIFHFLVSWYYTKRKTKWLIDYWYFILMLLFFIPVLIMYPFNASKVNIISTGQAYFKLEPYIDRAFAITIIGYICIWIGRYIYDTMKLNSIISVIYIPIKPFEKIVYFNINKKLTIFFLSFITIVLLSLIILIQFKEGYVFNPRGFFLKQGYLRPIYNLTISIYPITILYTFLFYLKYRYLWAKRVLYLLFIFGIFLGTRGTILGSLITMYMFYVFFIKKGREKINKILLIGIIAIFFALYIDSLRHGQYNPIYTLFQGASKIFYGNNFSDTRDFAWILSYWNGDYFWGKTYLAGLISFIPRFISDFRSNWAISVVTDKMVGFEPSEHAGLRPGMFGEAYLNFGILGVIILGTTAGYFLRFVDIQIKKSVMVDNDILKGYSKTLIYGFVSKFFITAGFWSFYVLLLFNVILFAINYMIKGISKEKNHCEK